MTIALAKHNRWLPCYRHGAWWLAIALLCTLLIGVSARASESLGPLAIFPLGLLTIGWFLLLVASSLCSAWRSRRDIATASACLFAPIASIAGYVLVLAASWWTWGALPTLDRTNVFQVEQTLPSPDGAWQAVYAADLSGGPMTGTSQDVYLLRQQPGSALFFKDRMFSLECIQDFKMRWIGRRTLQASYVDGDQYPNGGLLPREHLPLFHDRQDEWRFTDPVKLVEVRRIVHGNLC
jgi:hypothetical protein